MIEKISPSSTEKVTPESAWTPPNAKLTLFTSSKVMAGYLFFRRHLGQVYILSFIFHHLSLSLTTAPLFSGQRKRVLSQTSVQFLEEKQLAIDIMIVLYFDSKARQEKNRANGKGGHEASRKSEGMV